MPDNFHKSNCALRYSGEKCTCGYVRHLDKRERLLKEASDLFGFMESNGDLGEISTASQKVIRKWVKEYKKK
jgi:hypothetical protein